jgi:hypothetical protein
MLDGAFADSELLCPTAVCRREKTSLTKRELADLSADLGEAAKRAKLAAIAACGEGPADPNAPKRPGTPTYVAQLVKEITKLPNALSRCD